MTEVKERPQSSCRSAAAITFVAFAVVLCLAATAVPAGPKNTPSASERAATLVAAPTFSEEPGTSSNPSIPPVRQSKTPQPDPRDRDAHHPPDVLGVTSCLSLTLAQYMPESDRIIFSRFRQGHTLDYPAEVEYRPCAMPDASELVAPIRRLSAAQLAEGLSPPWQPTFTGSLVESFCLVFRARRFPAACHASLKTDDERCAGKDGAVNVLMKHRSRRAAIAPSPSRSPAPHLIVLLLDSLSAHQFRLRFPRTRKFIDSLAATRFVEFANTNALGAQSAANHAGLLLGVGRAPEKCSLFKLRREGIPRPKDGQAYTDYQALKAKVFLAKSGRDVRSNASMLFRGQNSWLASRNRRLSFAYYPVPQPAWEASCLGFYDEASWYDAKVSDVVAWSFYNAAVNMNTRDVNGSQGCIGHRHALDFMADFVRDAVHTANALNHRATVFLADQTPHQRSWGSRTVGPMALLDEQVAALLRQLDSSGDLANSVVVLAGDHGLVYEVDSRSAVLSSAGDVLRPATSFLIGRAVHRSDELAERLRRWTNEAVSHLDLSATLNDIASGRWNDGAAEAPPSQLIGLSWLNFPPPVNRTCAELGVFPHACRYYTSRPMSTLPKEKLLANVQGWVRTVNYDMSRYLPTAFPPCSPLPIPQSLDDEEVRFLGNGMGFVTATYTFKRPSTPFRVLDTAPVKLRFDTEVEKLKPGTALDAAEGIRLKIRNAVRVSSYKLDESVCGHPILSAAKLAKRQSALENDGTPDLNSASMAAFDVQFCLCRLAPDGGRPEGFVGG